MTTFFIFIAIAFGAAVLLTGWIEKKKKNDNDR